MCIRTYVRMCRIYSIYVHTDTYVCRYVGAYVRTPYTYLHIYAVLCWVCVPMHVCTVHTVCNVHTYVCATCTTTSHTNNTAVELFCVFEQYKLVREALRERAHLLQIAPHLSDPLPIMLPVYRYAHCLHVCTRYVRTYVQ